MEGIKEMSEKVLRIIATGINYIGFIVISRYLYPNVLSFHYMWLLELLKDVGMICLIIGTTLFAISIQKERSKEIIRKFLMINIGAYAIISSLIMDFIFPSYWVWIIYIVVVLLTEIVLYKRK